MPGDFSRRTFDQKKHYSGVLTQQGRVQVDADPNEQVEIQSHRTETETIDVVGRCGVPLKNDGFKIGVLEKGRDLSIAEGRIYVDGILCELEAGPTSLVPDHPNQVLVPAPIIDSRALIPGRWIRISSVADDKNGTDAQIVGIDRKTCVLTLDRNLPGMAGAEIGIRPAATFLHQPYYPAPQVESISSGGPQSPPVSPPQSSLDSPPASPPLSPPGGIPSVDLETGTYLAYLDVCKREVNHLDDPSIREVALGEADTTLRQQNVWQVRLVRVSEAIESPPSCRDLFKDLVKQMPRTTGRLCARAKGPQKEQDPCLPVPGARYNRLENQLYRIEIHKEGLRKDATFKWSRENGSVETLITEIVSADPKTIVVSDVGKDEVRGFQAGQWIEIVEERSALQGPPHELIQIVKIEPETRTITLNAAVPEELRDEQGRPAGGRVLKLRRWDQTKTAKIDPTSQGVGITGDWIELEGGIVVQFSAGYYRRGDYWLIPARTIVGDIEWPRYDGPDSSPIPQPPVGVEHRYCCLARITVTANKTDITVDDCRRKFPSLTELTRLHYVGGDGQEIVQDILRSKKKTLMPLPAPLRVSVAMGQWPVEGAVIDLAVEAGGGGGELRDGKGQNAVKITQMKTGADGVAQCYWWVDNETEVQQVRATLRNAGGKPTEMYIVFTARLLRLTMLSYLGGDGQQVSAGSANLQLKPLRVGVFKGQSPIAGAKVEFAVVNPGGYGGTLCGGPSPAIVSTDPQGIAECTWVVDRTREIQQVTATLRDADGDLVQAPIMFTATVWPESRAGCCATLVYPTGKGHPTLAEALASAHDKEEIILCLLPGEHILKDDQRVVAKRLIKMVGCAARIVLAGGIRCYLKAERILLTDLHWVAADRQKPSGVILSGDEVAVERCLFHRRMEGPEGARSLPLVLVEPQSGQGGTELRWKDNRAEAAWQAHYSLAEIRDFLGLPSTPGGSYEGAFRRIEAAVLRAMESGADYASALDAVVDAIMGILNQRGHGIWAKELASRSANADDARTSLVTELRRQDINRAALRQRLDQVLGALRQSGYAAALALAPGVGGWIEDSTVSGELLLHFVEDRAFTILSGEAVDFLRKVTRDDKDYQYLSCRLELGLRGNRLFRVLSYDSGFSAFQANNDDAWAEFNRKLKDPGIWLEAYRFMGYESMNVSENSFSEGGSSFIAGSLFLNGNCFPATGKIIAAHILGYEGVIVGNSRKGATVLPLFWLNRMEKAANLITVP